jgi:ABC-2 type transport system ATP-binding protein
LAAIIEIQNLTHRYGPLTAVQDLSLRIDEGHIFGFVGPNGAGKTTTMRILATLLRPTSGEAWVGGCSVRKDLRGVRRQIGYMPDFFGVYDDMKVWEYLDFFAACYEIPSQARSGLVDELLELVDLSHRRDDDVESLSRGMKQRLCLARTLAHDPRVLILDEPASGLDPRARIEIRELLRELGAMGKTIFLSSHILLEVAELCTLIGIVEAGALVAFGTLDDIEAAVRERRATRRVQATLSDCGEEAASLMRAWPEVHEVTVIERSRGPFGRLRRGRLPGDGGGDRGTLTPAFDLIVDFTGTDATQASLLARLVEAGYPVLAYQEVAIDLEDVFMQVTRGIVS